MEKQEAKNPEAVFVDVPVLAAQGLLERASTLVAELILENTPALNLFLKLDKHEAGITILR